MTALDVITNALKRLTALGAGETPDGDETADGLKRLNAMLDDWATQRLTIYYNARNTPYTLTAGTASYTIGAGATINVARPLWINNAGLIIDSTASTPTEVPIAVFTDDEWADVGQKTLQSTLSTGIWYDHNWTSGAGKIYPWPIPSVSTTQLVLYVPTALTQFADLSTQYTFPPGYQRAIETNLALELAPEYGRAADSGLIAQAMTSKGNIKRANIRPRELRIDPAFRLGSARGGWNYLTDESGLR